MVEGRGGRRRRGMEWTRGKRGEQRRGKARRRQIRRGLAKIQRLKGKGSKESGSKEKGGQGKGMIPLAEQRHRQSKAPAPKLFREEPRAPPPRPSTALYSFSLEDWPGPKTRQMDNVFLKRSEKRANPAVPDPCVSRIAWLLAPQRVTWVT